MWSTWKLRKLGFIDTPFETRAQNIVISLAKINAFTFAFGGFVAGFYSGGKYEKNSIECDFGAYLAWMGGGESKGMS